MNDITYVGLDVHKTSISVAVARELLGFIRAVLRERHALQQSA